jgi:UPF0271 protein
VERFKLRKVIFSEIDLIEKVDCFLKYWVDINCDLGESYGYFKVGHDAEIMPYITSANVACGFHAGDPATMMETVQLAKRFRVAVGAHPGFSDLLGFGRREMKLSAEELESYVIYQIGALQTIAQTRKMRLQHIKPHGALYNMAAKDEDISRIIVKAVQSVNSKLILFAPAKSATAKIASKISQPVAFEVFADRAYNSDGTLVPRSKKGSVIEKPELVVKRVAQMVTEGTVSALNGETVELDEVHTVCIHGDTVTAVELAKNLKNTLTRANVEVKPVGTFL